MSRHLIPRPVAVCPGALVRERRAVTRAISLERFFLPNCPSFKINARDYYDGAKAFPLLDVGTGQLDWRHVIHCPIPY